MPKGKAKNPAEAYDPAADNIDNVNIVPTDGPLTDSDALAKMPSQPSEPLISDPAWTPYVLSQLTDDELANGCPKVTGLRRVAALLLGEILEIDTHPFQLPSVSNELFCTAKTTVRILWTKDTDSPVERVFSALADSYLGNATDKFFARFPSAIAETRSEGRAWKRALNLVNITTAEEKTGVSVEESGVDGKITWANRNFIGMKCQQCNIDVKAYLQCGKTKYANIMDVPNDVATAMVKHISDMQRGVVKIPDAIRGYKPDWENE